MSARVLVIDDVPANTKLVVDVLSVNGYEVFAAASGIEGLARAAKDAPDLILLDVMMPGIDGFTACQRLKADASTRDVPVIFLTALDATIDKVRAFGAGAVDYLCKPFQSGELLARVRTHLALRNAQRELETQNARLREEIEAHGRSRAMLRCLEEEIRSDNGFREIVGRSRALQQMLDELALVAATDSTVLVLGETGTGKELIARAIHDRSRRHEHPLVKVNCAALPRELFESELFGHEKGAFTGATQQRRGRFELADGGTLFLDEVGELTPEAQAKLLRVLQEQEFERVGGSETLRVDVRLVAATNRDLGARAAAGEFRSDLYYRLNVFPVTVPPLRERPDDIPLLIEHFRARCERKVDRAFKGVSPAFVERAMAYEWPGNVRELQNIVERAAIISRGPLLDAPEPFAPRIPALQADAPATPAAPSQPAPAGTLEQAERAHIQHVLARTRWVIEGPRGAATILGLNASTLRSRMRRLGIRKHDSTAG